MEAARQLFHHIEKWIDKAVITSRLPPAPCPPVYDDGDFAIFPGYVSEVITSNTVVMMCGYNSSQFMGKKLNVLQGPLCVFLTVLNRNSD